MMRRVDSIKIKQDANQVRAEILEKYKKIEQINLILKQLELIEIVDADTYQYLQTAFVNSNSAPAENTESTHLSIAKLAIMDNSLKSFIEAKCDQILKSYPQQARQIDTIYIQNKLKWLAQNSLAREANNTISPINFTKKISRKKNWYQVREDAKKIMMALAPRICLTKAANGNTTEVSINTLQDLERIRIDAIFIMGNNDLKQVDRIASIYLHLKQNNQPPYKIYISGCGGHGTTPGYIFGSSEAETMAERLKDRGVPADMIVIEKNAIDTRKNIELTAPLIQNDAAMRPIQHILISGTPAAMLRQSRLFEKLANYAWRKIITFPPTPDEIDQQYNYNETNTIINIMYLLREITTFLATTILSPSLLTRNLSNETELSICINLLCEYYAIFTGKQINADELAARYIHFCHCLAAAESDLQVQMTQKDFFFNDNTKHAFALINEMNGYFRLCFEMIEREYMKNIRPETAEKCNPRTNAEKENVALSLKVQAAILNEQEKKAKEKTLSLQANALIDSPFAMRPEKYPSTNLFKTKRKTNIEAESNDLNKKTKRYSTDRGLTRGIS